VSEKKIIRRKTILKLMFDKQEISWLRVKALNIPSKEFAYFPLRLTN
jgi:hypothetical protein